MGALLMLGGIAAIHLFSWFTYRTTRRLVAPVSWLAEEVSRWDPDAADPGSLIPERIPGEVGREVDQLSNALTTLSARVQAFVQRERDFTRDASHELRTPLTVIRVASDMLLADDAIPQRSHRSLQRIHRATRDMEAVIDAFLILAREDDIAVQGEDFDVHDVVMEEVEKVQPLLQGKPVQAGQDLPTWVEHELQRLCEAFPVPVWLNDAEVPRPLAKPDLPWRETSMGKVLINLSGTRTQWRCFLQGLPIGGRPIDRLPTSQERQVVLLPDNTLAKLPDRQHLLNETEDHPRIQAAVDQAYREALIEKKQALAASDFVTHYAHVCLNSSNADLLNDVPFVPLSWFRDWDEEPAGYRQYWRRYLGGNGVIAQQALEVLGVWQIEPDDETAPTAEIYLEAAKAYVLDEPGLDDGHWLKRLIKVVSPEQVRIRTGTTLHREVNPGLADYEVELELVDTLHVGLEGHLGTVEYAVEAVRKGYTLYLTPSAGARTGLVCDYVFDDRYGEDREDEDALLIETFIAVGCSSSADRVVQALLPYALRHGVQPKLAGATVRLVFDDTGKLQAVTA